MRLHFTLAAALLLATLAIYNQSQAAGPQSGRLAALTARQNLCDLIAYARADGHISQSERNIILEEAQSVLTPTEYANFKQVLDRIAPPAPPAKFKTRQYYVMMPARKAPQALAQRMVPATTQPASQVAAQKTAPAATQPASQVATQKTPQEIPQKVAQQPVQKPVQETASEKKATPPTGAGPELVIPAGALMPDGVAQPVFLR
jgi:hypothetical protein